MKKMAVGIPTCNHPETVRDVLNSSIDYYKDCGVDLYFYDASQGNETENVVKEFIERGYTNLVYYRFGAETARWYLMTNQIGFVDEYEYFWYCKDRSYVSRRTLELILKLIDEKPDVIFLEAIAYNGRKQDRTYHDAALFYKDCGWLATSMDVSICRTDTMISGVKDTTYPPIFGAHYTNLFTRLAALEKPVIQVVSENAELYSSTKSSSSYRESFFQVWVRDWIRINRMLPKCYDDYKSLTIKRAGNLPWILGDIGQLRMFCEDGILTADLLASLEDAWHLVSDVPYEAVRIEVQKIEQCRKYRCESQLFRKMMQMAFEGQLTYDQIPFEDIKTILINTLNERYPNNDGMSGVIQDVVDDSRQAFAMVQGEQKEGKIMRLLLLLLLLLQGE